MRVYQNQKFDVVTHLASRMAPIQVLQSASEEAFSS